MSELATVEIHSPKDQSQKWIINQDDFDASKHVLWGMMVQGKDDEETAPIVAPEPAKEPEHSAMRPSVPDYVHDDDGNIVAVNIINPNQRNARLEIPYSEYDPDHHDLWSSHSRFH